MPTEFLATRTLQDADGLLVVLGASVAGLVIARVAMYMIGRAASATKRATHDAFVRSATPPMLALGAVLGARASLRWVEIDATLASDLHVWIRVGVTLLVAWGVVRAAATAGDVAKGALHAKGRTSIALLVPVATRIARWLTLFAALLGVLSQFGVDVTHFLAGLGIGGVALALAAQKTLENIFGGLSVVLDQPLRPGDSCRIGSAQGVVEEIGLRSTRLRTPDQTLISLPNATVATAEIENMSARTALRYRIVLPVRPDAPADQLQACLSAMSSLMHAEPLLKAESIGVQVRGYNAGVIEIELGATTTTPRPAEFAQARERLTVGLLRAIEANGIELRSAAS